MRMRLLTLIMILLSTYLFAAEGGSSATSLGGLADNVASNLLSVHRLIMSLSSILGVVFVLMGLVKFKAHRDNPQQNPMSAGIILGVVGFCLLYLPSIIQVGAGTLFGDTASSAGVDGSGIESI